MLRFDIKAVMKGRGVERPFTLLTRAGISRHVVSRLIHGESRYLNLRHVEIICNLLNCTPNDLLVWRPDKDKQYGDDFSLRKLEKLDGEPGAYELLDGLPMDRVRELAKVIREATEGDSGNGNV